MSRYADSVTAILMEQGRAQAQAQLGSGQAYSQLLGQLGQMPGQIQQQQQQQADQRQQRAIRTQQIASGQAQEEERRQRIAEEQKKAQELDSYKRIISMDLPPDQFLEQVKLHAPGQVDAVQKRLGEHEENAVRMEKLQLELEGARKTWMESQLGDIVKSGYNPLVAAGVMSNIAKRMPSAGEQITQLRQQLAEGGPDALRAAVDKLLPPKTGAPFSLSPGQTHFDAQGKPIASVPEKAQAPEKLPAAGSDEDYLIRVAKEMGRNLNQLSPSDIRKALAAKAAATRAPKDAADEPLVPIIGPDGQPVLVPRSQAVGKRPASTREQGRPVTSGDAGRLAELDTSLNDLDTLSKTLGTTGAGSKVGAMLPNVVTEYTGWGMDSKSRQGTIDRVKQVIGKALEGGVLRKEDEYKYEKILPTIGDPPPVAKAKLEGLQKALTLRRQTTIDALKDANYDVSKFELRQPAAQSTGVKKYNPATGKVE